MTHTLVVMVEIVTIFWLAFRIVRFLFCIIILFDATNIINFKK